MSGTMLAIILLLGVFIVGVVIFISLTNPSLERNWSPDQVVMPSVQFFSDKVQVNNIRDIHYRTTRDFDLEFYDRTINIDDVDSAWLVISPFGAFGVAHTFVSFGMKDGSYLSISIEIRRKKGKRFSPLKAFFRQFEMMYVIADESDVIKVRTNTIKAIVRLFPIQTEKKRIQAVFLDMLQRADALGKKPEFYNTVWNNCTTNIIKHTRRFSDKAIPFWDLRYLLPENLDKIAYKLDMIDTNLSYAAAREHFDITEIAQVSEDVEDFSQAIRAKFIK
ncbi:MAG TPA: DUF4105 domain-containing protein [Leucothrix mucor]|nr:DUF4105 domain-containing protein [Leucothrix mucor]